MTDLLWRTELGAKTTELLGRYGVAGRVEVESHLVWLIGNGPTVEVALSALDISRAEQDPTELDRLAERLARELASARRRALKKSETDNNWLGLFKTLPLLGLVAIAFWAAYHYLVPHDAPRPARSPSGATQVRGLVASQRVQTESASIAQASCARTVARIQQGGSITPMDVDGWVVELSLISNQPTLDPNMPDLDTYFSRRPSGVERTQNNVDTPLLTQADPAQSGVLVSKNPLASAVPNGRSGIIVTWRGQYVKPYFQEQDRTEYVRLADALYRSLHARFGALYARCAQGSAHYLGSWYRGPSVGSALAILVAEMDVSADVPLLAGVKAGNSLADVGLVLNKLFERLQFVPRRTGSMLLASTGGSVAEHPGQYATVQFPFVPGNAANIASVVLVRRTRKPSSRSTSPTAH